MKAPKALLPILTVLFLAGLSTVYAQTPGGSKKQSVLSLVGTLHCSACDLKKEQGAASQCSIYGHQYSFKAEKVNDTVGKRIENYEGKTYHILRNDKSKELAHEEHAKKSYKIDGKIYDEERVLEVITFSAVR